MHNAPAASSIVSYGPNPVTPIISPRPSTRFETPAPVSPIREHGYEEYYAPEIMKTPSVHEQNTAAPQRTATVQSYSHTPAEYYPPASKELPPPPVPGIPPLEYYAPVLDSKPTQQPSPEKKAPQIIVSYGPNRITPTPPIASSLNLPPSSTPVVKHESSYPEFPVMDFPSHPFPSHEAPILDFDNISLPEETPPPPPPPPPTIAPAPPLPPYASAADFYAMEKGAIRKLDEPNPNTAELPPTKDGYYQYGDRADEYELQGTGVRGEQQHPHQVYRSQPETNTRRAGREMDEQKYLLSEVELKQLRELKARKREEDRRREKEDRTREEEDGERGYEMQGTGGEGSGQSQS